MRTSAGKSSWLRVVRMTAPAAFLGYGLYLVAHSAIVGIVGGLVVLIVCRILLGPAQPPTR